MEDIINALKQPITDSSLLLSLLAAPLDNLRILPPKFRPNLSAQFSLPREPISISRFIPVIQHSILAHIAPTWLPSLVEQQSSDILDQYFCPDIFYNYSATAGEIVLLAYSTLLSHPMGSFSMQILSRLAREYPMDRLHQAIFATHGTSGLQDVPKRTLAWEDCVRNIVAVPVKAANANRGSLVTPSELHDAPYFDNMSKRCEALVYTLSSGDYSEESVGSIVFLLTKLVNTGVIPSISPSSRTQPSLFRAVLPIIRRRFQNGPEPTYRRLWNRILDAVPSSITLQKILSSLFASLTTVHPVHGNAIEQRGWVRREAKLLWNVIGTLDPSREAMWEAVAACATSKVYDESFARILTCWTASGEDTENTEGLELLLDKVIDVWSSPHHIKHSLISKHHYFTSLLLFIISYFPATSKRVHDLALEPSLINAVGTYIGHQDASVRRCGMLVGEIIAAKAGKKLQFDGWEGDDTGQVWCRNLRTLIVRRDIDVAPLLEDEIADSIDVQGSPAPVPTRSTLADKRKSKHSNDSTPADKRKPKHPDNSDKKPLISVISEDESDDSLEGYASDTSSRAPSPTQSELDDIEKDPTLVVQPKKAQKPVYLAQLGEMIMGHTGLQPPDGNEEAQKLQVALDTAEDLIRRKREYGTELEENAVNLVYGFAGLQDNYELDGFDEKRQFALTALVACCPQKSAPCAIQEIFKNQYSTTQRSALLNALAFGARELARLPLPPSSTKTIDQPQFPSKQLPSNLHNKYAPSAPLRQIADGIRREAIDSVVDATEDKVPELVRERRLRVAQPAKVQQVSKPSRKSMQPTTLAAARTTITFAQVAAEHFIMPLINRYWNFLREEQTREERTALFKGRNRYAGAGTGMLLNPLILSHLLTTLAILVHASRNATEWLNIISPNALELALAVGTRAASTRDSDEGEEDVDSAGDPKATSKTPEASVVNSALEIVLVVLDGSLALDQGRTLGLEYTPLLLGLWEWANALFAMLERGARIKGEGGAQEVKLRSTVAGVLLKAEEIRSKWLRSIIDTR